MRIYFQNPTQGPLITVSFDDSDSVSLAFVPAALSSAPASVTATGAAGAGAVGGASLVGLSALAVIVPGDSSPPPLPLQGINRFAPRASGIELQDGEQAVSAASPAGSVSVDLPGEATSATSYPIPTGENRAFLSHLSHDVKTSSLLTETQRQQLETLIERARRGEVSVKEVARQVWQCLQDDFLSRVRALGIVVKEVHTPNGLVYEFTVDFKIPEQVSLLSVVYFTLENIGLAAPQAPVLFQNLSEKGVATIQLPSWDYLFATYHDRLKNVQFVAYDLSGGDIHDFHQRGIVPLQLSLTDQKLFPHTGALVHGFAHALHDIFHALHWNGSSADVKQFSLEFYRYIKAALGGLDTHLFDHLIADVVDIDTPAAATMAHLLWVCLDTMAQLVEALSKSNLSPDPYREQIKGILMSLKQELLRYEATGATREDLLHMKSLVDFIDKHGVALPTSPAAPLIDWDKLSTTNLREFLRLAHERIAALGQELERRIKAGESLELVRDWFNVVAKPDLEAIYQVLYGPLSHDDMLFWNYKTDKEDRDLSVSWKLLDHNCGSFMYGIPRLLKEGPLADVLTQLPDVIVTSLPEREWQW